VQEPRYDFLARAALANDERGDGSILRDFLCGAEDALDFRRLPMIPLSCSIFVAVSVSMVIASASNACRAPYSRAFLPLSYYRPL